MYQFETSLRVRYAETDQMGFVYYGNYATYLEVARVEALRELGIIYKTLEAEGILLPVFEYQSKYIRPAHYDDELIIKVMIKQKPTTKLVFDYEIHIAGKLIHEAQVTLVFIDKETFKPVSCPKNIENKLASYI